MATSCGGAGAAPCAPGCLRATGARAAMGGRSRGRRAVCRGERLGSIATGRLRRRDRRADRPGSEPRPRFVLVAVHLHRSVDRPRRRRDRPERHRGHAGPPRDAGRRRFRITSSAKCSTVREADAARFRTLRDLAGRRVGTLGGTIAYEILLQRRTRARHDGRLVRRRRASVHAIWCSGVSTPSCSTTCWPSAGERSMPGFVIQPDSVADRPLCRRAVGSRTRRCATRIDEILHGAMRDGTLERIFRKWEVWNDDQPALHARVLAGEPVAPFSGRRADIERRPRVHGGTPQRRYLPSLLRASVVTLVLSCLAMGLAVVLGVLIASGRVYGNGFAAGCAARLRRADARHADPPAALRSVLRPRRGGAAAGVRGGAARDWR